MPVPARLNKSAFPGLSSRAALARALCLALYAAARFWRLSASCLWFDELFSLHAARHEFSALVAFAAEDIVHPPLFYLLLKAWIALGGDGILWLRLLPALLSIAALVPFLLLCRELRLRPAAVNIALLLWALSDYAIKYAHSVRMYSLLLCLGLTSYWLCLRFMRTDLPRPRRTLLALCIINLLLVYTHYYGWAVVGVELCLILLFARHRVTAFILQAAWLGLCFAPWALLIVGAAGRHKGLGQNIGWAPRPGPRDFVQYYLSLHELALFRWNIPISLLLFVLPLAFLLWRHFRPHAVPSAEKKRSLAWLALCAFAPAALAFIVSYALPHSVWGVRHLITAAPFYYLLLGLALTTLRPPLLRQVALAFLACWLLLAASLLFFRRPEKYIWCAWEPFTRRMRQEETQHERVPVFVFEDLVAYHVWSAFEMAGERRFQVVKINGVPGLREDPAYFLPRLFDGVEVRGVEGIAGERGWLLFRDASWDEAREPLRMLRERGYAVEQRFEADASSGRAFLVLIKRNEP